jgi:hypothetical protein
MGKECLPHGRMGSLAWSVARRGPLSQDSGIPTVTPSLPLRRGEFRCEECARSCEIMAFQVSVWRKTVHMYSANVTCPKWSDCGPACVSGIGALKNSNAIPIQNPPP